MSLRSIVRTRSRANGARRKKLCIAVVSDEDELIASESDATALHSRDSETSIFVKVENLFGFGIFVRIAADPVDKVSPAAHAALGSRLNPRGHILFQARMQDCAYHSLNFARSHNANRERKSQPSRQ